MLAVLVPALTASADHSTALAEVIAAEMEMNQTASALAASADLDAEAIADAQPAAPPPQITAWNILLVVLVTILLWVFLSRGWHRLRRLPERPLAFSSATGVLLLIGAFLLPSIGVGIAQVTAGISREEALGLREVSLLRLGQTAAEAIIVITFFVLALRARTPRPDRRFGMVKSIIFAGGSFILFWMFVFVVSWLIGFVLYSILRWSPDPIAHETLAQLLESERTIWFFIMIGIALLIAPIFEEVIYRGLLQELLGRLELPRWWAIVLTSIVFTLMHYGAAPSPEARPPMLAALFVLSLGFGWAYEKSGRLIAPITMHILFNAGNLTLAMLNA